MGNFMFLSKLLDGQNASDEGNEVKGHTHG